MISFTSTGSFKNTEDFLKKASQSKVLATMKSMGSLGVKALAQNTPRDSGLAAGSWGFTASGSGGVYTLTWTNSDVESGFPVSIMLQYGYSTGTGGYVQGRDYINPAMRPTFDQIADKVWKAVTSA